MVFFLAFIHCTKMEWTCTEVERYPDGDNMSKSSTYVQFAGKFLDFLEDHEYTPQEFRDGLRRKMGKNAPSLSTIYMCLRGQRLLPVQVILFMQAHYGWEIRWRHSLPMQDLNGAEVKDTGVMLPGAGGWK